MSIKGYELENLFTNHFFFGLIILLPDDVTSLLLADAEGVFLSINGYSTLNPLRTSNLNLEKDSLYLFLFF